MSCGVKLGLGARAVWGIVAARVYWALLVAQDLTGDAEGVSRDAVRFLMQGPDLLADKGHLFMLSSGTRRLGYRRTTCCLIYKIRDPVEYCAGCVLVPPEVTIEDLLHDDEG
jgi:ferric iron reductase protein FhuF